MTSLAAAAFERVRSLPPRHHSLADFTPPAAVYTCAALPLRIHCPAQSPTWCAREALSASPSPLVVHGLSVLIRSRRCTATSSEDLILGLPTLLPLLVCTFPQATGARLPALSCLFFFGQCDRQLLVAAANRASPPALSLPPCARLPRRHPQLPQWTR
jgi:hypothetical protein